MAARRWRAERVGLIHTFPPAGARHWCQVDKCLSGIKSGWCAGKLFPRYSAVNAIAAVSLHHMIFFSLGLIP
jgi:hypothetical protein